MNSPYIVYDDVTGAVRSMGMSSSPLTQADNRPGFTAVIGTINPYTEYINISTQLPTAKLDSPVTVDKTSVTADGIDEVVFSGILVGDLVTIDLDGYRLDDYEYTVDDAELTFDAPGTYSIIIESPVLLNKEITINAT
jgi:hypothetical protein